MIIQIRGTSGSGKTWAMREIMKRLPGMLKRKPVFVEGRKKPLYYLINDVVVMGHYEIDCGGCDTIGSAPKVYQAILKVREELPNAKFLTEGLLWSEDVQWSQQLSRIDTVKAVFLTTPATQCLEQIKIRQKGKEPADPARVVRKMTTRVGTIERARLRLIASGIECKRCSSTQAVGVVLNWLGCTPTKE